MLSEPDEEEGKFDSKWEWENEGSSYSFTIEDYLESVGCPHKPRQFAANFHRLFEDTAENRVRLESFVERQDLAGYLALIGIENVQAAIEYTKCSGERFDRLMKENDQLWLSDDASGFLAVCRRMSAEIDMHRVDGTRH